MGSIVIRGSPQAGSAAGPAADGQRTPTSRLTRAWAILRPVANHRGVHEGRSVRDGSRHHHRRGRTGAGRRHRPGPARGGRRRSARRAAGRRCRVVPRGRIRDGRRPGRPEPLPRPDAHAEPVADAEPRPDADPDTDAGTHAGSGPGATHGSPRAAGRGCTPGDRDHDRRPPRRSTAVGLQRRLGRVAGPGRRRHPALHADLPGPDPGIGRARAQRPAVLHRVGGRVGCRLRPLRRFATGAPHAAREGQRPARLQRRRVPLGQHLLPPLDRPLRAPQRLHDRQGAAQDGQAHRRGRQGAEGRLAVRPRRSDLAAAEGRADHDGLRLEHDQLPLRPQDQHVPPLGQRRGPPDRTARPASAWRRRTSS